MQMLPKSGGWVPRRLTPISEAVTDHRFKMRLDICMTWIFAQLNLFILWKSTSVSPYLLEQFILLWYRFFTI
ncbi:hypothetical protein CapIbe_014267 [Capra ibex]